MKRYFIIALLALFAASCEMKEDYFYDETPDERLNAALKEYEEVLVSAPNGWLFSVNTGLNGGYRHWLNFDEYNRVVMLSDLDASLSTVSTSVTPQESSWRLKSQAMPSLIFDTYNYLHILADPQASDNSNYPWHPGNGGTPSEGYYSDFEFYIRGFKNGSLDLVGKYNDVATDLTAATAEEAQAVMNGDLKTIHEKTSDHINSINYFFVGNIEDIGFSLNMSTRAVSLLYRGEDGKMVTISAGAYPDFASVLDNSPSSNLWLFDPITIKDVTITGFTWNGTNYEAVVESGDNVTIEFSDSMPYTLDLGFRQDYDILDFSVSLPGTMAEWDSIVYLPTIEKFETVRAPRIRDYMRLYFTADATTYRPTIHLQFRYMNGSTAYEATWIYQMTTNEDGTITITDRDQNGSTNESTNEYVLKDILDYFCYVPYTVESNSTPYSSWVKDSDNINPKTFRMEWVLNKTVGSGVPVGALVPVDVDNDPFFKAWPVIGAIE